MLQTIEFFHEQPDLVSMDCIISLSMSPLFLPFFSIKVVRQIFGNSRRNWVFQRLPPNQHSIGPFVAHTNGTINMSSRWNKYKSYVVIRMHIFQKNEILSKMITRIKKITMTNFLQRKLIKKWYVVSNTIIFTIRVNTCSDIGITVILINLSINYHEKDRMRKSAPISIFLIDIDKFIPPDVVGVRRWMCIHIMRDTWTVANLYPTRIGCGRILKLEDACK